MPILVDLEKCVACAMCMLACSHRRTGGFNVRRAELAVIQGADFNPREIRFHLDCPTRPAEGCEGVPPCVDACAFGALTLPEVPACTA